MMYYVHEEFEPVSSWSPPIPEEIDRIEAIRKEKESACVHLSLSDLPKAFWGFLGPKASGVLGGHPDPAYVSALEKQLPKQDDLPGLQLC